jgi:hypothetical protein
MTPCLTLLIQQYQMSQPKGENMHCSQPHLSGISHYNRGGDTSDTISRWIRLDQQCKGGTDISEEWYKAMYSDESKTTFRDSRWFQAFGLQVPAQPLQVISFSHSVCCSCCLLQAYSSTPKFEAICSSETSVLFYWTELRYIPKYNPHIEYSDIFLLIIYRNM